MLKKIGFCCLLCLGAYAQEADVVLTHGHTDQINSMDISAQGNLLLSGGNDKLVKVWDLASAKELRTFTGNDGRLVHVRFCPDGEHVAGLNYQNKLLVWKLSTGKLVQTFEADSGPESFGFAHQGKNLVYLNEQGQLVVVDYLTGTVVRTLVAEGLLRFLVHPDGKRLYYLNHLGFLKGLDVANGAELSRLQVNNPFSYPVTRMDISPDGTTLAACYVDNQIHLYDLRQNKEIALLKGFTNRLTDLQFEKSGTRIIGTDHDKNVRIYDYRTSELKLSYETPIFGATCLVVHPKESVYIYAANKSMHYHSFDQAKELKQIKSKANQVVTMDYDQQGKYLASAATDISIKVWNLAHNKIERSLPGFFPVKFSPSGQELVCMGNTLNLQVYNPETGDKNAELPTKGELIQNLSFSRDGKLLSGAGFLGVIKVWDMDSKQILLELKGHQGGIYGTSFSPDGKFLASAGMDQTVRVWRLADGIEIKSLTGHEILVSDVVFSPDGKYLASCGWDKKIFLWNTQTWELERVIEGHVNSILAIDFSSDGKYIVSGSGNNVVSEADNSIRVWEVATGELFCKFENPTGQVNQVVFEQGGDLIFSCGNDGFVKIWDLKTCKEVMSLASIGRSDYIFVTPDYYYTASREALQAISFRVDNQLFPLEQFDLQLNRPDLIAERLGKTPAHLMNAHKYIYKKRLKKMNFNAEQLSSEFHLPQTSLDKANLPLVTKDSVLKFNVSLTDSKYKIKRLLIYLNGVPIYSEGSLDLSQQESQQITCPIELALLNGRNEVQVSCINEKGSESFIESFGIIKESGEKKGRLFIVSVGVSQYAQEKYHLNYAAKDALDVLKKMRLTSGIYKEVHELCLLDTAVNLEALDQIMDFLKSAEINDVVILFFAGHGVLDEDFSYYFGSQDIDFQSPAKRGIPYSAIEALLAQTKAFKRLLLIDTCHSGEVDKEELEKQNKVILEEDIKFRAVGNDVVAVNRFGMGNTQELMGLMFTESRKSHGATVISSAGGAEYAIESGVYQNGLFTYCLLNALDDWQTDLNRDQTIQVSEWGSRTYLEVERLSHGLQKPTSRSSNLQNDFRVK